jgi:hypothetical protein
VTRGYRQFQKSVFVEPFSPLFQNSRSGWQFPDQGFRGDLSGRGSADQNRISRIPKEAQGFSLS